MHTRRLASLLLGAWLAGSLFMIAVATGNFAAADRLLANPAPRVKQYIKTLGAEDARALLRYQVSEINRRYFERWEEAQLAIGLALLLTLVFATNGNRLVMGLSLGMLVLVVIMHWLLTPQIVKFGTVIDFAAADAMPAERARFWRLHTSYTVLEMTKLVLGIGLSAWLLTARRRSQFRKQVDAVDDADHTHVNR